jgi:hypothetical protein
MSSGTFSRFTFRLIEPSLVTLPIEVKDDMKESSYEAAGLPLILAVNQLYGLISIFVTFWM